MNLTRVFPRTFPKGGIYPRQYKGATRRSDVWNAALPAVCVVPMLQHAGKPATPVVAAGDGVREGTVIGKAAGRMSAHVHSPIPGTVRETRDVTLADGRTCKAVVIELRGEFDKLGKEQTPVKWRHLKPASILSRIRSLGLVELAHDAVPVHLTYSSTQVKPSHLLVNGAESEPYLSAEHRLMVERTAALVEGIRMVERAVDPGRVLIGVQTDKRDALRALRREVSTQGLSYEVVPLQVKYPQGDEKQLVKALTSVEVPSGQSARDSGMVVTSVATVHAVYEALAFEKPLIERVVTVAGGAVRRPGNVKVRLGTSVGLLLDECGGFTEEPARIVLGGPMRGSAVGDLATPITKNTPAVLALTAGEVNAGDTVACIQCGLCTRSCPMGIEPERLHKLVAQARYEESVGDGLFDCTECGVCSYVCPSHIPIVNTLRTGKSQARSRGLAKGGE